ncbi:phosphoglucosamine mutase [Erysipelothrix larvae]|uniref:Phosphoglucosamine mutase n=1 Tax=Erysipelothrix larvae TaxID=1514105 RepID=A0A0X8GYJ1_9FIRM|nr:phosphoglucosamine mutase [Erysipelothrix larvae]AMC92780.1 phosphoglucosamine mutase [Erysipelothrix larvae]
MGKYFGTDGIRGKANGKLTPELALKVGQYLGYVYRGKRVLIGQDTRLSSSMLASALAAGITSMGADAYQLGVCATPALAYTVKHETFEAGVMISASHNPFEDNGLKVFSHQGTKIDDTLEGHIEAYIDGEETLEFASPKEIGIVVDYKQGMNAYRAYLEAIIHNRFDDLKVALDLANGSAVSSAKQVFEACGATVFVMNDQPDGVNINVDAGSTHPEKLQAFVVEKGCDVGFAFDGDADRCLAVDHTGTLIDGDNILYAFGVFMKREGSLNDNTVVATVMANLGFTRSLEKAGIHMLATQVGDKYVYQKMVEGDYSLGGEQSGHIILRDYATTGDGVLTALKLAQVMVHENKSLHDLVAPCMRFPQLLKNVPVASKEVFMSHPLVLKELEVITEALGDEGRILVRPSGTEELVRVMVEAKTDELCHQYVEQMIQVIESIKM